MPWRRVDGLLPQALKGLGPGLRRGQILAHWRAVVGPELARLAPALGLEEGVLLVAVPDPALRHQLAYRRLELLERLQARFPEVREIRFLQGPPPAPELPAPPPDPGPAPGAEAEAQGLVQGVPEPLRGPALRLARLLKARPGGVCPVCGARSPQTPCPVCRRHLEDPLVQRAAEALARGRGVGLEGDLLEAARHLARGRLRAEMEALFPMALQDPGLVPLLKDLARRYRALCPGEALPAGVESLAGSAGEDGALPG